MIGKCAAIAAVMFGCPAVSHAQDSEPGAGDIVVTTQRRPALEGDVPASTDVLSRDRLLASTVRSFDGLARVDTGTEIAAYQGETQIFVRGVGAVTFIGGFDGSIGVYSDGVYLSRPSAIAPAMFDVDRVEILKGPQGTLYGRNATGGAINIISRGPTENWTGDFASTVGNYNNVDFTGAIGGPVAQNLSFRLAVGSNNHSGYTTLYFGKTSAGSSITRHAEDQHDVTTRLSLRWQATPSLAVDLAADYYRADDRAVVFQFSGPGYDNSPLFRARISAGEVGPYGRRQVSTSFLPFNRPENWGLRSKVSLDLGSATLSWINAYHRTRPQNFDDLTNSTILGESQFKQEDASQLSQEIVLASDLTDAKLHYVLGASYFRERNQIRNEFFFPYLAGYLGGSGQPDCCLLKANGSTSIDTVAAYGEATVSLTPVLSLTGGGRYSEDRKSGRNLLDFVGYALQNDALLKPVRFHSFTPKVGLELRPRPGMLFYANVSRGFKAGGFNVGSTQNSPYEPESIWAYELGFKVDVLKSAHLSGSAFHYDYSDMQVQDVAANTVLIRNAASAKVDGVEARVVAQPFTSTHLDLSATYLHARFSDYSTINTKTPQLGLLNLSGNPLPQSPTVKVNAGIEQSIPGPGNWAITARGDVTWQDRIYFSAFKDPRATQAAYWWIKARLTLASPSRRDQISFFADNLTDTHAFTNISITGDLDGSRGSGNLAPPRTYGVQLVRHW